ncbi:hypothetical protein Mapa_010101 [Marchantia paleacea]|nr:hypothetical protein Mapa_010101 [Marchantia paleacea]
MQNSYKNFYAIKGRTLTTSTAIYNVRSLIIYTMENIEIAQYPPTLGSESSRMTTSGFPE